MGRVQVLRVKERFEYVHAGQNLGIFIFARKVAFLGEDSRRGDSLSLENLSHRFLKIPRILFYICDI